MARCGKRALFSEESIDRAKEIIEKVKYGDSTITAISVLLASVLHLTSDQIGEVLCVSSSTVLQMNRRFCKQKQERPQNWGGKRNSILSTEETEKVLESLKAKACEGKIVVIKEVKEVLEQKRKKRISLQTTYNILHRYGWRKIVPDKAHPKSAPEKQEEFKKKRFHMRYVWLPSRQRTRASNYE